ncbi:DUF805 domain-containing protein [Rhodobacteraceae bacterium N5(2021)]|uniref:DUF805 domain-containing protein n=1 Tax=Gymnodinialimonas phycosphaerae TaxID=2841589 RepID=A0A975TRQ3_9RHOB|nr:DUF805 domain-containing protein [Gymnodinialimonas phycosphaerae]MBY4893776.1 DUF805 domain-containing protein [Gymnodinialimonas phycosphaerae]
MLNFSGRARRAEYWWFMLWIVLASVAASFAAIQYLAANPEFAAQWQTVQQTGRANPAFTEEIRYYIGYLFAANLVLFWLPQLAVTIRRLHDTNRSGAWWFIQLVPLIGPIWLFVLMCLPGTHGNNRFGPDSAPDRKRAPPAHPAFAGELTGEDRDRAEVARRAAAKDYYKRHVLPSIQNA